MGRQYQLLTLSVPNRRSSIPSHGLPSNHTLINLTQQLRLQNEFPLLVLLACLIRLVVFPPHGLLALLAVHVPHLVPTGRHVPLHGFGLRGVYHGVEEEGFAVLAAEILLGERVRYGFVRYCAGSEAVD